MPALDRLTHADFAALLHETFRLRADADVLDLELIETTKLASEGREGAGRAPFSVLFRGPLDPILPQQIYRLEHPKLGALEVFLVPVGRGEDGVRYELVFA